MAERGRSFSPGFKLHTQTTVQTETQWRENHSGRATALLGTQSYTVGCESFFKELSEGVFGKIVSESMINAVLAEADLRLIGLLGGCFGRKIPREPVSVVVLLCVG